MSVQAQTINLPQDVKARYAPTFISHDPSVVKIISDRTTVMYLGTVCDVAGADHLFARPAHHHTR